MGGLGCFRATATGCAAAISHDQSTICDRQLMDRKHGCNARESMQHATCKTRRFQQQRETSNKHDCTTNKNATNSMPAQTAGNGTACSSNAKHATDSVQPTACNVEKDSMQHATDSMQQRRETCSVHNRQCAACTARRMHATATGNVGNRQHATDSMQQPRATATCNVQQQRATCKQTACNVGNRQQQTCNVQQTACNVENRQHATYIATCNRQRATDNVQQTACNVEKKNGQQAACNPKGGGGLRNARAMQHATRP